MEDTHEEGVTDVSLVIKQLYIACYLPVPATRVKDDSWGPHRTVRSSRGVLPGRHLRGVHTAPGTGTTP
eukprot:2350592-Rhodomonas_salina.3